MCILMELFATHLPRRIHSHLTGSFVVILRKFYQHKGSMKMMIFSRYAIGGSATCFGGQQNSGCLRTTRDVEVQDA